MRDNQKGIAIIAMAISLVVLIPVLGLGVDAAMLWSARTKLNSACDAAALATARNVGFGATLPDQVAYATSRGEAFFQANFDPAPFRAAPVMPVIRIVETTKSNLAISASARVNIPLYFMRFLGTQATEVQASSILNRRNVDLVLSLDTNVPKDVCQEFIRSAKIFTSSFLAGRDRLELLVNGSVVFPKDAKFKEGGALAGKLDGVSCSSTFAGPVSISLTYPKSTRPEAVEANVSLSTTQPTGQRKAIDIKIKEPAAISQAFSHISTDLLFSGRQVP